MKLLNIDDLRQKTLRTVQIGGKSYNVHPVTVATIIETTKQSQKLAENAKNGIYDQAKEIEIMVDLIQSCLPDVPRFELEALTPELLNTLAEYVRGGDDEAEVVDEQGKP